MKRTFFLLLLSIPVIGLGQKLGKANDRWFTSPVENRFATFPPNIELLRITKDTLTINEKAEINFIKIGDKLFKIERSIELKPVPDNGLSYWPNGATITPRPWQLLGR